MVYRYAVTRENYADFSGGVLHSAPGFPQFPVRLASEMFQRAIALVPSSTAQVWDPCCGSGHLLTALAFQHRRDITSVLGTDVEVAERCGNRRPRVERLVSAWNQGISGSANSVGEPDDPLAGTLTVAAVVVGFTLANLPYTYDACAGEVVSTDLCEPARLGRTIFGAILAGSAIIGSAVIAGAMLLAGKRNRTAAE